MPHHAVADAFVLNLGEQRFDPLRDPVRYPAGWQPLPDDGPALRLVQFAGPIRDEWLGSLEIVQYIHPFTYVVWSDAEALSQRAQAGEVRWTGDFAPACRVLPRWRDLPDELVLVDVLVYRGAGEEATLRIYLPLVGQEAKSEYFRGVSVCLPDARFCGKISPLALGPGAASLWRLQGDNDAKDRR